MCGIAGFVDVDRRGSHDQLQTIALQMAQALQHRGPDASGTWIDADSGVAFAHTRLSIIDLSAAGAQPMSSHCGRFIVSYNGEVYNAEELRSQLAPAAYRGHSDTEVILEGFTQWGIRETVQRLIGMFALAVWDRESRKLSLVRDRMGIKPLYWGLLGGRLVFASELKGLKAIPGWNRSIDRDALAAFFRYGYVPTPASIYHGISKLTPGTMLEFARGVEPAIRPFWSLEDVARRGQTDLLTVDDEEAVAMLDALLSDAVRRRMISDVPFGAFLSGGIDSSTVAALMQKSSNKPVRTFSIGFGESGYDEAGQAKRVAKHLGCDHEELYVTPSEALSVIPDLPRIFDEPFADSSQIPTYLVSRLTRRHVTVALSGDGGDELFGGYNRHVAGLRLATRLRALPLPLRRLLSSSVQHVSPQAWDRLFSILPEQSRPAHAGDKMHKLARTLPGDLADYYRKLISPWDEAWTIVDGARKLTAAAFGSQLIASLNDDLARIQYLDMATYLPDDILTKVDRASMAVALEARVPLIDHRVVEFSWRLPSRMKVRDGKDKWLLRQVLYKYVPHSLVEGPKRGFAVPLDTWLRGPLREWASDLLRPPDLKAAGIDPAPVHQKWTEHQSGMRNWSHFLWNVLMFEAWRRAESL